MTHQTRTFRTALLGLSLAALAACGGTAQSNNGAAAAAANDVAPEPAAAAATGSPAGTVLAEFDRVCSRPMEREAYVAAASGAGWAPFEPEADSPLGRLIAMGERAARQLMTQSGREGELTMAHAAFRKTANGRDLVLMVTLVQIPGMERSLECRVYDFTAPVPTQAEIAAWTSTPPGETVREQGITGFGWRPGFREGFSRIDVTHVDPTSPLRAQIPVTGLSVVAFQGPTTD